MNNVIHLIESETKSPFSEATRKIILHYHLFKNAGTSLDGAFKKTLLAGQWVTKEFPVGAAQNQKAVYEWVKSTESAVCFSSHTAEFPVPEVEGVDIFPVIFIRHPIDRIASAYAFEARQNAATFGSTLARNTNLAGYIETRLSLKFDHQCRDFHARRFGAMAADKQKSLMQKVEYALEKLPFIGIVEKYDQSISELNQQLFEFGFSDLKLINETLNVSRKHGLSLEEKLEKIREEIGNDLFSDLEAYNSCDLELHELVSKRYE